jgi:UDP-4-amino-4,6-dideoxy-N-acetyl-beta-L-altrosamine N-acetyltransferase
MFKFIRLKEDHLHIVLKWRTNPEISQFMLSKVEDNIESQRKWFRSILEDRAVAYWVILYKKIPIGLINIAAIDLNAKKCNAGFYIGELQFRQLTAFILPYFYNLVFRVLGFNKIYGEVLDGNSSVLKIHLMHGYRHVGKFIDHVFIDGQYKDIHLVELTSTTWLAQARYLSYFEDFEGDRDLKILLDFNA